MGSSREATSLDCKYTLAIKIDRYLGLKTHKSKLRRSTIVTWSPYVQQSNHNLLMSRSEVWCTIVMPLMLEELVRISFASVQAFVPLKCILAGSLSLRSPCKGKQKSGEAPRNIGSGSQTPNLRESLKASQNGTMTLESSLAWNFALSHPALQGKSCPAPQFQSLDSELQALGCKAQGDRHLRVQDFRANVKH